MEQPQNKEMEHRQRSWCTTTTLSCSNDTSLISLLKYGQNAPMSRMRMVTAGLIQFTSKWFNMNHIFFRPSILNLANMVFLLSAVKKKPHTTQINIFSLIFTTFTSFAFPLQPAKWRTSSLHYIKHYLPRNWELTGSCCFNICISIPLDQKITKSAKQTNSRSQMNTVLSIIYGKVKIYHVIGK